MSLLGVRGVVPVACYCCAMISAGWTLEQSVIGHCVWLLAMSACGPAVVETPAPSTTSISTSTSGSGENISTTQKTEPESSDLPQPEPDLPDEPPWSPDWHDYPQVGCDPFGRDCMGMRKCVVRHSEYVCKEVPAKPDQAGDVCWASHITDSCELGSMCIGVSPPWETTGVCAPFCHLGGPKSCANRELCVPFAKGIESKDEVAGFCQ